MLLNTSRITKFAPKAPELHPTSCPPPPLASVHLLHLVELLPVLLAAAVDHDEDGGREENNKHATKVEKVDTETLNLIG